MPDEFVIDENEVETAGETPTDDKSTESQQELIDKANRLSEALRISEDARQAAQRALEQRHTEAPKPEEPKELTREELTTLMQEDPAAAIDYINSQSERRLQQVLQERLGPITSGAVNSVEASARTKYATEFELFADQIEQLKSRVDPQVLANPETWDQMVAYVRGLPQNFEKMVEHRLKGNARQEQAGSTGFVGTSVGRSPKLNTKVQLDDVAIKIAETLGMSPEEYVKWGGGPSNG